MYVVWYISNVCSVVSNPHTMVCAVLEDLLKELEALWIQEWVRGPVKHKHHTVWDF